MFYRRTLAVFAFASLTAFGCANAQTVSTPKTAKVASVDAKKNDAKAEEIALIRAKLATHREEQIARLEAYAAAGTFPLNVTSAAPLHQLKDASGTYCAVANLAVKDGLQDVIDAESKTHNDLLFGELKDGQLYSWILTSGLTQEELAQIQAPAPYVGDGEMGPIPQPMPGPVPTVPAKELQAKLDLQAHFRAMEAQLTANTDASLDVAANRLEGTFGSVALSLL